MSRKCLGSVVELATRVVTGELSNALAVVRPPGHHCEARQAMGFCLLNNVAVAAAVARARLGVQRVLIVDWDVYHGSVWRAPGGSGECLLAAGSEVWL